MPAPARDVSGRRAPRTAPPRLGLGSRIALLVGLGVFGCGVARSSSAAVCDVPSASHPTVGAALRDAFCTTIQLAAGVFEENVAVERDVILQGAGSGASVLAGHLAVTGATTDAQLSGLGIDGTAAGVAGCWGEILSAAGGAEIATGPDVVVLHTAAGATSCRLFADGFESGSVLAWTAHAP